MVKVTLPAASVVCVLPWTLMPVTLPMVSLTTLPAAALPLGRLPDTWILKLSFRTLTTLGIEVALSVVSLTLTLSLIRTGALVTVLLAPDSSTIIAVSAKVLAFSSCALRSVDNPAGTLTL